MPSQEENFINTINAIDEIQECHFITGEYAYLLKIRVKDTKALEKILGEKIKIINDTKMYHSILTLFNSNIVFMVFCDGPVKCVYLVKCLHLLCHC